MIYLDNAATTLRKPPQVIDAVARAMGSFGNSARGTHEGALTASRTIYNTRCKLAALFGCPRPDHVVFTANSTEALNITINGLSARATMCSPPIWSTTPCSVRSTACAMSAAWRWTSCPQTGRGASTTRTLSVCSVPRPAPSSAPTPRT